MTSMDSSYPVVVMAPLLGLAAYCLLQMLAARAAPSASPYRSLAVGFACGLVVVLMVAGWAAGCMPTSTTDRLALVALDFLTYLALAFGYFNFVNLTVASLRIRILEELSQHEGRLTGASLVGRYSSTNVVRLRLERLIRGGHLVEREGRLFSGKLVFLVVARTFDLLRMIILGRRTPRA